ncbi:MAG TPA: hypothetical protein VMZ92_03685 [Planctomycetota bacterium]|nr:hypothetical protein [Planctomycetota bacterium]
MKLIGPVMLAVVLVLTAAATDAAGRIGTAVLPVKFEPTEKPGEFEPAEYLLDQMIIGMSKVERFDVVQGGDLERVLKDHLFKPEHVKLENAEGLAKALKVRLLLFPVIQKLSLEVETEDRVLIQTKVAVCTVSVGGTLFDVQTGKTVTFGPYVEEDRKMGAESELRHYKITSRVTETMVKNALAKAGRNIRSHIYKLYPLAGKVSLVDGKVVTIDIGSKMGVAVGHQYVIYGMVERENVITGLKEKVREEVSMLQVDEVTEDTATCHVIRGEESPSVGSEVVRSLRR